MAEPRTTTSDFFENQAKANRSTGLLVVLFLAAVVLIILVLYVVVCGVVWLFLMENSAKVMPASLFLNPKLFAVIAGGALLVILGGTIFKIVELRQGGSAVAFMLGAVPVPLDTTDPDERKLLNVIDEMAIASGCPPPSVFIMRRERSINAFAAGFTPTDAAICVTQGAIIHLTREELQGVVAHEFSHIVNGDMRLNIRLMGVLHGILQISMLGTTLMYLAFAGGGRSSRRSSRDNGGGGIYFLALGAALFVVGYIGVLFGKMIKAAVSRQREFLADAAAIQYTRYPAGLAGALKKIGGLSSGARLRAGKAEEASHFLFCDGMSSAMNLGGMLSTHPPLDERIRRIQPGFDGQYPELDEARLPNLQDAVKRAESQRRPQPRPAVRPPSAGPVPTVMPPGGGGQGPLMPPGHGPRMVATAAVLSGLGRVRPGALGKAREILQSIPDSLRNRVRTPAGSRAVVLAILLGEDDGFKESGLESHLSRLPGDIVPILRATVAETAALPRESRLPLFDLCLPTLRGLEEQTRIAFLALVRELIAADQKRTLFEFCLERILSKSIDPDQLRRQSRGPQFYSLKPLLGDIAVLLSALSYCGASEREEGGKAFASGVAALKEDGTIKLLAIEQCGLPAVGQALDRLAEAAPGLKRRVLVACVATVNSDGEITAQEAELLRAVAEALDCPMPL